MRNKLKNWMGGILLVAVAVAGNLNLAGQPEIQIDHLRQIRTVLSRMSITKAGEYSVKGDYTKAYGYYIQMINLSESGETVKLSYDWQDCSIRLKEKTSGSSLAEIEIKVKGDPKGQVKEHYLIRFIKK